MIWYGGSEWDTAHSIQRVTRKYLAIRPCDWNIYDDSYYEDVLSSDELLLQASKQQLQKQPSEPNNIVMREEEEEEGRYAAAWKYFQLLQIQLPPDFSTSFFLWLKRKRRIHSMKYLNIIFCSWFLI